MKNSVSCTWALYLDENFHTYNNSFSRFLLELMIAQVRNEEREVPGRYQKTLSRIKRTLGTAEKKEE